MKKSSTYILPLPSMAPLLISLIAICLLTIAPKAEASYAFVQSKYDNAASGEDVAFDSEAAAGNTIIIGAAWGGADTPGVKDSQGNTYTLIKKQTNSSWSAGVWAAYNIKGGANAMTLTLAGQRFDATYSEYSGLTSVDAASGKDGTGGMQTGGSISTSQAEEMIYGFGVNNGTMPGTGAGFTSRASGVFNAYVLTEDNRAATPGTYAAEFGETSKTWLGITAGFKSSTPSASAPVISPIASTTPQVIAATSEVVDSSKIGGGFFELLTSTVTRPLLFGKDIPKMPSTRGSFTFPAPYETTGYRITHPGDCGGNDCVYPVGYSYWTNMNNSTGSSTMYIMVGLDARKGGAGPSLFSLNKKTNAVTRLRPLFPSGDTRRNASGEGWYFSATTPTMLYVQPSPVSPTLQRYDILSRKTTTVLDISTQADIYGSGRYIPQFHSSDDDNVHSFTVKKSDTYAALGCGVYLEKTNTYKFYPSTKEYDECQIDGSGRWLVIKEQIDGKDGEDNRIIDLNSGKSTSFLDPNGAAGHSDLGHGYMIAWDNWYSLFPAMRLWKFGTDPMGPGTVIYREPSWNSHSMNHISWGGANAGSLSAQYVCGSDAGTKNGPRTNEIVCVRADGSQKAMIVAPVMTDLTTSSAGGDDYSQMPKGNLDPTGEYYIWSSNAGTNRTDVFMVKVPRAKLISG